MTITQRIKRRTFEVLEVAPIGDLASRIFGTFIMTVISLNVLAVILETVKSVSFRYLPFLKLLKFFPLRYLPLNMFCGYGHALLTQGSVALFWVGFASHSLH